MNLVDLVDTPRTGASVKVFPNLKKLQDYTITNEKYFPKEDAYAGGLLRFFEKFFIHTQGEIYREWIFILGRCSLGGCSLLVNSYS